MLIHKSNKAEAECICFNKHLIKFLQSNTFTAIVESSNVPKFHCHSGMCVIVQVLWRELLSIVWNELPSKIVESLDNSSRTVNIKVEVNSFFGWAILEEH
jgi:hypothetical protein